MGPKNNPKMRLVKAAIVVGLLEDCLGSEGF